MNNEPVAWMSSVGGEFVYVGYEPAEGYLAIPLYTHPAKTLTISDKDILKIIHDKFTKFGFESDYIVEDIELIEFAKEILRKAQEK